MLLFDIKRDGVLVWDVRKAPGWLLRRQTTPVRRLASLCAERHSRRRASFDDARLGARKDCTTMGCTTSLGRSPLSRSSTLADRRDDRRQRAIAELDRNGVNWREPIQGERFRFVSDFLGGESKSQHGRALDVRQISGRDDFISTPDARPMGREDICNVELVAAAEAREVLHAIARKLRLDVVESDPLAPEAKWGDGWPASDERWTLTPHALRKLRARPGRRRSARSAESRPLDAGKSTPS